MASKHYGDDVAQMLTRRQLRHHTAIVGYGPSVKRQRSKAPRAPPRTTAAEVSSHELSMPRIRPLPTASILMLRSTATVHRTPVEHVILRRRRRICVFPYHDEPRGSPRPMPRHANSCYTTALGIVHRLRERPFVAYFAGGCVRDLLFGHRTEGLSTLPPLRTARRGSAARFRHTEAVGARVLA